MPYNFSMNAQEVAHSICTLMQDFATADLPPIAYISIEAGADFPVTDAELAEAFDKAKWDTGFSSAELLILRKPNFGKQDSSLIFGGFSLFADEVDGKIDSMGIEPTFCFVGKRIC